MNWDDKKNWQKAIVELLIAEGTAARAQQRKLAAWAEARPVRADSQMLTGGVVK
jgi:hypothetical protein